MDTLFDLRLDGELDRESFDTKRNDIQLKIERIKRKIASHEKADICFDDTILGLLDIATQAGYFFEKSSNYEMKRLLLKFVFEKITLTEGVISYKLRFPFNEFVNINNPKGNKVLPHEPMQTVAEQRLQANDNENVQIGYMKSIELAESLKNQGLAKISASPIQAGCLTWIRTKINGVRVRCPTIRRSSNVILFLFTIIYFISQIFFNIFFIKNVLLYFY